MDVDDLVALCPRVFHVASARAWPSIQQLGLLPAAQLVELYDLDAETRSRLLTEPRTESVELSHATLPPAVLRDQKPMKFLAEKIAIGHTQEEFFMAINSRVFFWSSEDRVARPRDAREYRTEPQVRLTIDTRRLVERHGGRIELCRFNSGAITQRNHPNRGPRSWIPVDQYPYDQFRQKYGARGALAEVTVLGGVPDVLELALEVDGI